MNKKKVKELSLDVLTNIKEAISRTDDVLLSLTLANIASKIALIGVEVNKSDWVSVADELPPYEEDVLVCNKNEPDEIWFSHRTKESWVETDKKGFTKPLNCFPITHFRKIDKLED